MLIWIKKKHILFSIFPSHILYLPPSHSLSPPASTLRLHQYHHPYISIKEIHHTVLNIKRQNYLAPSCLRSVTGDEPNIKLVVIIRTIVALVTARSWGRVCGGGYGVCRQRISQQIEEKGEIFERNFRTWVSFWFGFWSFVGSIDFLLFRNLILGFNQIMFVLII